MSMGLERTALLNLDPYTNNTLDAGFFVGMKVYCRGPCQLLIAVDNQWIIWASGELAFLGSTTAAYLCFLHPESARTIKIRNGCEWSRPHSNLLIILEAHELVGFNFPVGYEKFCDKIESYLLNRSEPMKILRKFINQVRNIDFKIRDNAEKFGSCVSSSETSDEKYNKIGLPESFRHLATVRLEDGWLTARCTNEADSSTMDVIAAAGLQPKRTQSFSIQ